MKMPHEVMVPLQVFETFITDHKVSISDSSLINYFFSL